MQENENTNKVLQANYNFQLRALFEQGWALTQQNKWLLVQSVVLIAALAAIIFIVVLNLFNASATEALTANTRLTLDLLLTILLAPFFTALLLMSIQTSQGVKVSFNSLFDALPYTIPLGLTALISALLVQLGMLLLILPGVYLAIATGFAMPLVVDKQLSPFQAIQLSIRVVNRYWLDFVKLYGLFILLFALSLLTLGLALIWVAPLYYNIKGILYRDLFISSQDQQQQPDKQTEKGAFHA